MRVDMVRRISVALERLNSEPPGDHAATGPDAEQVVERLERAVDEALARADEAEATNRRLMAALAEVPEGVVIAAGNGEVAYRNPQAASFAGARHGEALVERTLGELLAAALGGRCREENLELFSPPRRTLTIRGRPLLEAGRSTGAVVIIEDVSEKRRLEAVRRDFVANISHELKTPVGALSLVAETLEGEDDPEVVARLSHSMHIEAERLGRIIGDLLDLSRIEAEESPSRDPVPVHLVVGEAIDRLRPVAEHRRIRLEMAELRPRLIVCGDRRQLVSAVYNLVDNAIKYSDDQSAVQVTVTEDGGIEGGGLDTGGIEAGGMASGGWVEIKVADHGIGIPSRDLERVFERFYRVDRARSRDTGGTGLGLAIVGHVAGNHGGQVSVDSCEGEGSTFTLRLPGGVQPTLAAPAWEARDG